MLLSRIILAIIVATVIEHVDANIIIVQVVKVISDYKNSDIITSGSGESPDNTCHCVYGNCSCNSLDQALGNLTSNILINITTDVTLSSPVEASYLENVSIVGHNSTVNCRRAGRLHFTSCKNCIIKGITWKRCGTKLNDSLAQPALKFSNSSDVMMCYCSFQHSVGQAVVLSNISGNLKITDCKFVNNILYKGHGGAINFLSDDTRNFSGLKFTISNCNFSSNNMKV